jgi:hypothetical protein
MTSRSCHALASWHIFENDLRLVAASVALACPLRTSFLNRSRHVFHDMLSESNQKRASSSFVDCLRRGRLTLAFRLRQSQNGQSKFNSVVLNSTTCHKVLANEQLLCSQGILMGTGGGPPWQIFSHPTSYLLTSKVRIPAPRVALLCLVRSSPGRMVTMAPPRADAGRAPALAGDNPDGYEQDHVHGASNASTSLAPWCFCSGRLECTSL